VRAGIAPLTALALIARGDDDAACSLEVVLGLDGRASHIPVHGVTPAEALSAFLAARARLLSALAGLQTGSEPIGAGVLVVLDGAHARDRWWGTKLEWWSEEQHIPFEQGPAPILIAAVRAARKELLTTLALLPPNDRQRLQPELMTLAREEERILRPESGPVHAGTAWEDTWRSFHDTHHALVRRLEATESSVTDLEAYRAITRAIDRDRSLAFAVRAGLPTDYFCPRDAPAPDTGLQGPERKPSLPG
jgi:hypothetical protein